MLLDLQPPLLMHPLTAMARCHREGGWRSTHAFTRRRCPMLLARARPHPPARIAQHLGGGVQTVRQAIQALAPGGLACRTAPSCVPRTGQPVLEAAKRARPHQRAPAPAHVWQQPQPVDGVAVGRGLSRRGLEPSGLERPDQAGRHGAAGSHVETGPTEDDASRPGVAAQQPRRDRLIRLGTTCPTLALGGPDDVWWSRLAPPSRSPGADDTPFRLAETTRLQADPDAQALAGDGFCRPPTAALRWRFVHGRPVSQVTGDDRAGVAQRLVPDGKQAWRLIWDNASWPLRNRVRTWLKPPHQCAKPAGGGRLLVGHLPSKSPWLHPIDPRGVHGTRAIVEPERPLTAPAVIERVCADDGGENLTPMTQQVC
jgi:hypothetical protein